MVKQPDYSTHECAFVNLQILAMSSATTCNSLDPDCFDLVCSKDEVAGAFGGLHQVDLGFVTHSTSSTYEGGMGMAGWHGQVEDDDGAGAAQVVLLFGRRGSAVLDSDAVCRAAQAH